jgi:hypothetical protein
MERGATSVMIEAYGERHGTSWESPPLHRNGEGLGVR